MKKTVLILMLAASVAVPATTKKKVAAKKTDAPAATIKPLVIPSDATPNPDGTYSYTDKQGKKWIFSKTPFGISRIEDTTATQSVQPAPSRAQFITAVDSGDTVKFTRKTPFGETKWEKKKSDLNDEERTALAGQNNAQ